MPSGNGFSARHRFSARSPSFTQEKPDSAPSLSSNTARPNPSGPMNSDMLAGLVPGDAGFRLARRVESGQALSGRTIGMAVARALAVMENNGSMRCVVAAPTAGACGVLPGAFLSAAEERGLGDDAIVDGLLVAAAVGVLVAMRAPISGAIGGCQSEIGVASAMTAAGLAQLGGGTPEQVIHAAAIALKNLLGLICDPVAGPVEIPCIKRNAVGVSNAFAAADMALAGIASRIPPTTKKGRMVPAFRGIEKTMPASVSFVRTIHP